MADYKDLVILMKRAALDAVKAQNPCGVYFGQVVSSSPLEVRLSQKIVLDQDMLILPENLTDYDVTITMDGIPRSCTVRNGLKGGDVVAMIRMQGGQRYLIVDKVVSI